jgi:hypothetical protein
MCYSLIILFDLLAALCRGKENYRWWGADQMVRIKIF